MTNPNDEILIIGSGFAGLSIAIFLKSAGIPCRIFESNQVHSSIGGGLCFFANGMNVLRNLGIADEIIASGHTLKTVQFKDDHERTLMTKSVDYKDLYGEPTVLIKRAKALSILIKQVQKLEIPIEFSKKLINISFTSDSTSAFFEDGSVTTGKLLIGADGLNSSVRDFVLQKKCNPIYSKLIYVGGFVNDQEFVTKLNLKENYQNVSLDPAGVTSYALIEGTSSIFWGTFIKQSTRLSRTELNKISDKELIERIMSTHIKSGGTLRDIIARTDEVISSNVSDIEELPKWSRERAIIIGDAAHAMNPMLGLGACVSLEDAHLLAQLLIKYPNQHQLVFKNFEEIRKIRTTEITMAARNSAKIGTVKLGYLTSVRNFAIYILGKIITTRRSNKYYSYLAENDLNKIASNLKA